MSIRRYSESDFDQVVALWDRCGLNQPHNDPARDIAMVRDARHAALFVMPHGERLIGTVMVGHDAHRGWLYRLAVAPEHRGLGHGRALVGHAERWLALQGLRKVQLMIRDGDAGARDFYLRVGYGAEPRMVMSKWLDPARRRAETGRLPVVISYLEMTSPPARAPTPIPPGKLALLRAENPPVEFYRYLYNTVGEPWFWTDRRKLDDAAIRAIVGDPKVEIYVLYVGGVPGGYSEIDRRAALEVAIAYFGLMPQFIGRGLGSFLMNWTVDTAWLTRPRRVIVNTCTLDHPKALALYQRAGFVAYRQESLEIDDPRRAGLIPPHVEPRLS